MKKTISSFIIASILCVSAVPITFANPAVTDLINSKDPYEIKAISNGTRIDKNTYLLDREGYDTDIVTNIKTNAVSLQKNGESVNLLPKTDKDNFKEWVSLRTWKKVYDIVTQTIDGGVRQVVLIYDENAPKYYDFEINLPEGFSLVKDDVGGVQILNEKWDLFVAILPPWAKDKNDTEITTWYEIVNGNILRQFVEFNEKHTFPIVVDPSWCGDMINTVTWITRNGEVSLSVNPTSCGRGWIFSWWGFYVDMSWQEVLNKMPASHYWDGMPGTSTYRSMYNQFICHIHTPLVNLKNNFNLEPHRPDVWYWATLLAWCNPN